MSTTIHRRPLTQEEREWKRRRVVHALKCGMPGKAIARAQRVNTKWVSQIAKEEGLSMATPGTRWMGVVP